VPLNASCELDLKDFFLCLLCGEIGFGNAAYKRYHTIPEKTMQQKDDC
jgi:hypothetical protein